MNSSVKMKMNGILSNVDFGLALSAIFRGCWPEIRFYSIFVEE